MSEGNISVNFCCQHCSQPLRVDPSFSNINEHTLAELSFPINPAPDLSLEAHSASFSKYVPSYSVLESITHDFTLLGDFENPSDSGKHAYNFRLQAEMFDLLSNNTDVDHPLCEECTDTLLDLMDQQLRLTEEQCNDYNSFLKILKEERDVDDSEGLERELNELKEQERSLSMELEALKKEVEAVEEEKDNLKLYTENFNGDREKFYHKYLSNMKDVCAADDEYYSMEAQLKWSQYQLERLQRTNVFNATFHIWHAGHFATINQFRMGRLPGAPVKWDEINAALGQTSLLLAALARKINFTFKSYRVVPYGNHSYIECLDDQRVLPLYTTGGMNFMLDTRLDSGLKVFLDCIEQFQRQVEKRDPEFTLPYPMDRGRIRDPSSNNTYSVRIQFNSGEQWTKALKFVLTNLKWCLAWVSSQFAQKDQLPERLRQLE